MSRQALQLPKRCVFRDSLKESKESPDMTISGAIWSDARLLYEADFVVTVMAALV